MKYLLLTLLAFLSLISMSQEIENKNHQHSDQPKINAGNLADLISINKIEYVSKNGWITFSFTSLVDMNLAQRERLSSVYGLFYGPDKTFIGSSNVEFSLLKLPDAKQVKKGDKFLGYIEKIASDVGEPTLDALELFSTHDPQKNEGGKAAGLER